MASTRFTLRANARLAFDPGRFERQGGDAPVILALHDLLADRTAFSALAATLQETHRVIAPDARGHGTSASLANRWYTVAELALDAEAILEAEQVERYTVIGHGLGATTALELARRSPAAIDAAILIEPDLAGLLDNDSELAARAARAELRTSDRAAADASYKGLTDRALDGYLAPRWGAGWRAGLVPARQGAIRRHAGALAALLPALDAYSIERADLRALDTPALIIESESATTVDALTGERLAALLPSAQLVRIDTPIGPGIDPAIVEVIRAFLEERSAGT